MAGKNLRREDFVATALDIIAESSVDALSMRKVAARLNVSAMAMYKHFPNKEALLSAALDAFIASADVIPSEPLPWEQWVETVARRMYSALCRDMSWVSVLGAISLGEQAAYVTDSFVDTLTEAGFSAEQAIQSYFTMIQLVVGAVCIRSSLIAEKARPNRRNAAGAARSDHHQDGTALLYPVSADSAIASQEPLEISLPLFIAALRHYEGAGHSTFP